MPETATSPNFSVSVARVVYFPSLYVREPLTRVFSIAQLTRFYLVACVCCNRELKVCIWPEALPSAFQHLASAAVLISSRRRTVQVIVRVDSHSSLRPLMLGTILLNRIFHGSQSHYGFLRESLRLLQWGGSAGDSAGSSSFLIKQGGSLSSSEPSVCSPVVSESPEFAGFSVSSTSCHAKFLRFS